MTARPLSFEDFSPRVGQTFTMRSYPETDTGTAAGPAAAGAHDAAGAAEIVLTECERSTIRSTPRSFNLLFRAGPDVPREQGLYLIDREDFEPAPIFLVPVRALPDGLEFHAVFNPSTEDENVP
jgi:hypothetical protein